MVFTYDLGGNILTKQAYAYTTSSVSGLSPAQSHTYTYGNTDWKDQLTAFDDVTIEYDDIGNPTDDGTWEYDWPHGKQLRQMQKTVDGVTTTIVFEYNEDGLRTKKTVTVGNETTVTEYLLHGKNVMHLTRGTDELHFYYDAQDKPAEVIFNGVAYGYLYNLQGDVVALVDGTGAKVVEYGYDAWGKPISKTGSLAGTLGALQPFRYRGYVFDEETGDYYLRSRYYRAEWGRFVSADSTDFIYDDINLYSYCANNSIINFDQEGTSFKPFDPVWDIGTGGVETGLAVIAVLTLGGLAYITCKKNDDLFVQEQKRKPINLPSPKRINLDMDHILSGHSAEGNRGGPNKDRFPPGMSAMAIAKAIKEAYRFSERISTQGNRVYLSGPWGENIIRIWLNLETLIIETAWPKYK